MKSEKEMDKNRMKETGLQNTNTQDGDLYNPKTGERRKSEEQISKEIDETEEGSGFAPGGGQPFTG